MNSIENVAEIDSGMVLVQRNSYEEDVPGSLSTSSYTVWSDVTGLVVKATPKKQGNINEVQLSVSLYTATFNALFSLRVLRSGVVVWEAHTVGPEQVNYNYWQQDITFYDVVDTVEEYEYTVQFKSSYFAGTVQMLGTVHAYRSLSVYEYSVGGSDTRVSDSWLAYSDWGFSIGFSTTKTAVPNLEYNVIPKGLDSVFDFNIFGQVSFQVAGIGYIYLYADGVKVASAYVFGHTADDAGSGQLVLSNFKFSHKPNKLTSVKYEIKVVTTDTTGAALNMYNTNLEIQEFKDE